ncbi:MAG: Na+/H+ antiporter NhaC family protein, partial [Bacteroidales bacterium]|nr:Na+/H+ antiporter NhaC family protein [Bacteroidales bacterium]
MQKSKTNIKHLKGLLALSPLVLFLLIYLATSIFIGDFYKIPIASAFLIASIYALILQKGKSIEERITVFSQGAGHKNILLMIWIFILAGAFAATAKEIGAIESTVNFTLSILPSNFLFAGLFIASCFISMSIGTSVGTIVALAPIASGIAAETSLSTPFLTAIVVGGSFFGDNLSFISDTTIAATRTQECNMSDKFKANVKIAAPAAVIVAILYIVKGFQTEFITAAQEFNLILLLPYIAVIGLAISRINVIIVLTIGLILNAAIGFSTGVFSIPDFLSSVGGGIANM